MLAFDEMPHAPNIYNELFESSVPRLVKDDDPLLVDASVPSRFLTFAQLRTKVRHLASALRGPAFNLQEGDVVAVCTDEDIDVIVALYGIVAAGCAVCLIRSESESDEIQGIFDMMEPKVVVANLQTLDTVRGPWIQDKVPILMAGTMQTVPDGTRRLADYTGGDGNGTTVHLPAVDPDTSAFLLTTSGSTGLPKRVNLTHRSCVARIRHEHQAKQPLLNAATQPRILAFTLYGFGPFLSISTLTIQLGVPQYMVRFLDARSSLDLVLDKVQEFSITLIYFLRTQMIAQIASQPNIAKQYDLSTLKYVTSRGQSIPNNVLVQAAGVLQAQIINYFASTETGVILELSNVSSPFAKAGFFGDKNRTDTDIRVVDEQNQDITSVGVEGELLVKGPMNAVGYYKNENASIKAFDSNGYYHTSDLFTIDGNGRYINLGRKTDRIVTPEGYFYPTELEELCYAFGGIKQCVAIGVFSLKRSRECVRVYITTADTATDGFDEHKVKELIAYVDERAPNKAMRLTGGVKVVEDIPLGNSGKADRKKLRTMAQCDIDDA